MCSRVYHTAIRVTTGVESPAAAADLSRSETDNGGQIEREDCPQPTGDRLELRVPSIAISSCKFYKRETLRDKCQFDTSCD